MPRYIRTRRSLSNNDSELNRLRDQFGNLSAVYLDEHGPNVVFHRSINPQEVIDFIDTIERYIDPGKLDYVIVNN